MTYDSDSGRLTFLKETAHSLEWLRASTGKLYHSLSHWIVFTQVLNLMNQSSTSRAPLHFFQRKFAWEKDLNERNLHWMHNWNGITR